MRPEDRLADIRASRDPKWPVQHPALDEALTAAIRAPVADTRFDRTVWQRIRAEEDLRVATAATPMRFGMPLWLVSLNVAAVAIAAVTIGLALGVAGPTSVAKSVNAAFALSEHTLRAARLFAVVVTCTALWLSLRQTPFARAVARACL